MSDLNVLINDLKITIELLHQCYAYFKYSFADCWMIWKQHFHCHWFPYESLCTMLTIEVLHKFGRSFQSFWMKLWGQKEMYVIIDRQWNFEENDMGCCSLWSSTVRYQHMCRHTDDQVTVLYITALALDWSVWQILKDSPHISKSHPHFQGHTCHISSSFRILIMFSVCCFISMPYN